MKNYFNEVIEFCAISFNNIKHIFLITKDFRHLENKIYQLFFGLT